MKNAEISYDYSNVSNIFTSLLFVFFFIAFHWAIFIRVLYNEALLYMWSEGNLSDQEGKIENNGEEQERERRRVHRGMSCCMAVVHCDYYPFSCVNVTPERAKLAE